MRKSCFAQKPVFDSQMSTSSGGSEGGASSRSGLSDAKMMTRAYRSLYKLSGLADYQCSYCSNAECLLCLCGNCRSAAYCSKECQQLDWSRHKKPCKLKNPTHFQPKYRQKVESWFLHLPTDEVTAYLVDSFRLRCLDEQQICGSLPKREDVPAKFLRFLHAAKGAKLLPSDFKKLDYMAARNEAVYRYNVVEIADGKGLNLERYGDTRAAIEDLRALHTVVCGPVLTGDQHPNLI